MKSIIVLMILFIPLYNFAQKVESKSKVGVSLNSVLRYNINISPQLSYSYGKFTGKIGPTFGRNAISNSWQNEDYVSDLKISGGLFSFQANPNVNKYFDLFFVYNFAFYSYKNINTYPYYFQYSYETAVRYIDHTFGYGFNFKFYKNFYLTSYFALGFSYEKTTYSNDKVDTYRAAIFNLNAGLGYNFVFKKNKTKSVE